MSVRIHKAPSQCHDVTSHNMVHVVPPAEDQFNYTMKEKNPYSQTHTKIHTEAIEGSPMRGGTLGFSICLRLHFPPAPSSLSQPYLTPVISKGYHMVVNTNISVN
jgi:hypothetical protein